MRLRYEYKYLVRNELLPELRRRLQPFLQADTHAEAGAVKSQYTVRSIYFDTPDFAALKEKSDGVRDRKKLRIRGYNSFISGCNVFLEIKHKYGQRVGKNRALTQYETLNETLDSGLISPAGIQVPPQMQDDAMKFFFQLKRHGQRPVNLVVYEREPFHGRFDPDVRITFDKNVRAALFPEICELFEERKLSLIWKDCFILEVKFFEGGMPSWMKSVIREFELRQEALSKYASAFYGRDVSHYKISI